MCLIVWGVWHFISGLISQKSVSSSVTSGCDISAAERLECFKYHCGFLILLGSRCNSMTMSVRDWEVVNCSVVQAEYELFGKQMLSLWVD